MFSPFIFCILQQVLADEAKNDVSEEEGEVEDEKEKDAAETAAIDESKEEEIETSEEKVEDKSEKEDGDEEQSDEVATAVESAEIDAAQEGKKLIQINITCIKIYRFYRGNGWCCVRRSN